VGLGLSLQLQGLCGPETVLDADGGEQDAPTVTQLLCGHLSSSWQPSSIIAGAGSEMGTLSCCIPVFPPLSGLSPLTLPLWTPFEEISGIEARERHPPHPPPPFPRGLLMRRSSCPVLLAKGSVQTCCHGNENYSNNWGCIGGCSFSQLWCMCLLPHTQI
jgi:hypothetical protein